MDRERENKTNANNGKSLPPRSTIHKVKEENPNKNQKNTLYMISASIIFAIIIITFLYNQFSTPGDGTGNLDAGTEYNTPSEQDDSGSGDVIDNQSNDENTGETGDTTNPDEAGEPTDDTSNEGNDVIDQPAPEDNHSDSDEPPVQGSNEVHVIEDGENLYQISLKYYDSGSYFNELAQYNGLSNANEIYAGLEIKIPPVEVLQQLQGNN